MNPPQWLKHWIPVLLALLALTAPVVGYVSGVDGRLDKLDNEVTRLQDSIQALEDDNANLRQWLQAATTGRRRAAH